jgi:hypothetical protein
LTFWGVTSCCLPNSDNGRASGSLLCRHRLLTTTLASSSSSTTASSSLRRPCPAPHHERLCSSSSMQSSPISTLSSSYGLKDLVQAEKLARASNGFEAPKACLLPGTRQLWEVHFGLLPPPPTSSGCSMSSLSIQVWVTPPPTAKKKEEVMVNSLTF